VREILEADPSAASATNMSGSTPLHGSVIYKHAEVAQRLIEHGADVNAHDSSGATPLCYAVVYGDTVIAELLLNHGANPNISSNDSYTPLHWAAELMTQDIAALLINKGAIIDCRNKYNETPAQFARKNHRNTVADYIDQVAHKRVQEEVFTMTLGCHDRVGTDSPLQLADARIVSNLVAKLLLDQYHEKPVYIVPTPRSMEFL